jgi:hypothetical protein
VRVLCEDFAQRIGLRASRVLVADRIQVPFDYGFRSQSPTSKWACLINAKALVVALGLFSALQLQFIIAHALMHQVPDVAEWECDLSVLDWMNCPDVPILESTACAIARMPYLRTRALQFISGQRIVTLGDGLVSEAWDLPSLRASQSASRLPGGRGKGGL